LVFGVSLAMSVWLQKFGSPNDADGKK
jgi:hypothetical protein